MTRVRYCLLILHTLSVSELAGSLNVRLNLSGPASGPITVNYSTAHGNTGDLDVAISSSDVDLTIPANSTSHEIEFMITDDIIEEGDETFTLTLNSITGAVFANDATSIPVTITIIDNEDLPELTVSTTQVSVTEAAKVAEIGLNLSAASTEPISIAYTITNNTATQGTDFELPTGASLIITSGTTGTISIPIIDDTVHEGTESFTVKITKISGASYRDRIINAPIPVTITDNESAPSFNFGVNSCENSTALSRNSNRISEGAGNLVLNATLSHQSQIPQLVSFSTVFISGSATATDFYQSSNTRYTIFPGNLCIEILTPIIQDAISEEDEQFQVRLNSTRVNITIVDDDPLFVSAEDATGTSGEGGSQGSVVNAPITLSNEASRDVSVNWRVSTEVDNTATYGVDYLNMASEASGTATIKAGYRSTSVPINIIADTIHEGDETFTITLSDPADGAQLKAGGNSATITIPDDDPEPTLTVSESVSVNEADGKVMLVISLSNQTVDEITLQYSTANDTAIGDTDFMTFTDQNPYNSSHLLVLLLLKFQLLMICLTK